MIPNSLFLEEHVRKKCLYLKYLCKNKSSARRFLSYVHLHVSGLLVGRGKKSQISRDFQGQIRGKNGRFRGNFAGIFEASFAEKRLVKNGRFRESFPNKFRWKAIGFMLI